MTPRAKTINMSFPEMYVFDESPHWNAANDCRPMNRLDLMYVLGLYTADGSADSDRGTPERRRTILSASKYVSGSRSALGRFTTATPDTQSDRTIQRITPRIRFSVPHGDKARIPLIEALERNNIKFRVDPNNVTTHHLGLYRIAKSIGRRSWEKSIPRWILDSPAQCLHRFLDGLLDGDGNRRASGSRTLHTTSCELVRDFCEASIRMGSGGCTVTPCRTARPERGRTCASRP